MLRWLVAFLLVLAALPSRAELTAQDALEMARSHWDGYEQSDEAERLRAMLDNRVIVASDGLEMPISIELIWDEDRPMPEAGYPVFISMHGGGAFTEQENLDQWDIQKTRYPGVRGWYICPHSPMDTWDQWHNQAIFRLIETLVHAVWLRDDVDPNRIYLTGYCSGGNGVYQLGPVMADHYAAVSATKALSEGAPLANLRNCPIDLQWGEHDEEPVDRPEHNRANVAELYELFQEDRKGYAFREIEHWRQGRFVNDKSTVNWLARWTRDPLPSRVVWVQGGGVRPSSNPIRRDFYWLCIEADVQVPADAPASIVGQLDRRANAVQLWVEGYPEVGIWLNDTMLNLDRPITVYVNGERVLSDVARRTEAVMAESIQALRDPSRVFSSRVWVPVPRRD